MNKFFTALVISACLIIISSTAVFSDDITITTYFPSPYGSYLKLSSDQVAIGADYRSSAIPSNGLIVEGQVGIGMTNPGKYNRTVAGVTTQIQTQLDVAGEIAANDVYVKDKGKWLSGVSWCKEVPYGPSGTTSCPANTSYAWFQKITGSWSNAATPGTVIPGGTCPCGDTCPDATCPDSPPSGYDVPISGTFLCCS